MRPYADTNFFTRFYLALPEHRAAVGRVEEANREGAALLPITWLHRLELVNALQLHVFAGVQRGQTRITAEQAAAALATFREHLEAREFLGHAALDAAALEAQFEALSLRHTARYGFRTYDLLHVSSALVLGCDGFWSFDPKAARLAALEGLATYPTSVHGAGR
jgi:predicted nucleic acid-binding protein